jgi:hypothetical protein
LLTYQFPSPFLSTATSKTWRPDQDFRVGNNVL